MPCGARELQTFHFLNNSVKVRFMFKIFGIQIRERISHVLHNILGRLKHREPA